MLFTPFKELNEKQNLNQVKDNSIGMGLACSKQIAISVGGDITIKESQRGLTIFAFKIPVQVKVDSQVIEQLEEVKEAPSFDSSVKREVKEYLTAEGVSKVMRIDVDKQNQTIPSVRNS